MPVDTNQEWETLNTRSVLAHVRLPEAFQISLGLFEHANCKHLRECLIGRHGSAETVWKANDLPGIEEVHSQSRLVDSTYTEVSISWMEISFTVQSASVDGDLFLKVTLDPDTMPLLAPLLTVEASVLWNRNGASERCADRLILRSADSQVELFSTQPFSSQAVPGLYGAHATLELKDAIGLCTGQPRCLGEIEAILDTAKQRRIAALDAYGVGEVAELAGSVSSALGWTRIFDPSTDQILTTVSRIWASRNNGSVIFCWDSFFAAIMAQALGDHELAHSNLEAITQTIDSLGYVPNVINAVGEATFGHSQPPIGSMAVRYIQESSGDPLFSVPFLDRLLTWNRWWAAHRDCEGYLCWGSTRESLRVGGHYETMATGNLGGAKFESGLDNSPIFDDAVYDEASGLMLQADVGLISIYIRDCKDLAYLCEQADRTADANELRERAARYATQLEMLWDEASGMYLNYDLATRALSPRLSPCNFYVLLTGTVSASRVQRIVHEHLFNPDEFWGEYVLPSIARNDPAYADQSYWRGRVWAPMNFLVYWALISAGETDAARQLAQKGNALILKNWRDRGFIGENYNADTGLTGERANSDPFNPWGALLGLIGLIDANAVPALPKP